MTRTLTVLAVVLFTVGAPLAASAETAAVVVAGDPGKKAAVVDAIAPWLQTKGLNIVLDSVPDADVDRLVDCFLTDDQACARSVVSGAGVGKFVFVMIQVSEDGPVELTAWLFGGNGSALGSERRECPDCRVEKLTRTAEDLIATLWRPLETTAALHIESTPSGAAVSVDGEPVGTTPVDVPTTPGTHEVSVSLDGYDVATRSVDAAAGHPEDVALNLVVHRGHPTRARKLPWIVMGAGAVAIVAGAVLIAADEDVPPLNPNGPEQKHYFDSALGGVSLVAIGALAVGGGVYLWLRGRRETSDTGLVVGPTAHGGAIAWRGRF